VLVDIVGSIKRAFRKASEGPRQGFNKGLGLVPDANTLQTRGVSLLPFPEESSNGAIEGSDSAWLKMADLSSATGASGDCSLGAPQTRTGADVPRGKPAVAVQGIDVPVGDTAAQVTIDILQVFRFGTIDVTGMLRLKSFLGR